MADARRAALKDQTDITGARALIVEARFMTIFRMRCWKAPSLS